MKRIVFIFSILAVLTTSCSDEIKLDQSTSEEKKVDLAKYEEIVYSNRELLSQWAYANIDAKEEHTRSLEETENQYYEELKGNLLPSAIEFANELNITKEEIETMTGEKINDEEELEEALVGLMLFVTTANESIVEDETFTRGGSFKDCFIEATGIAAGVAIVGGLSKGVVSKAVVKATLKLVAKVGTKTLNGVGLALLAAEIAWCMY